MIFILNLVSYGLSPRPAWRAIGITGGGLVTAILSGWYIISVGRMAASAHSAAASGLGGQIDQIINRSARADVGAVLACTVGLLLLTLGAIEFLDRRSRQRGQTVREIR